jgi:hypothetical protein
VPSLRTVPHPHARSLKPACVNHLLTLPLALTANVVQPPQNWPV